MKYSCGHTEQTINSGLKKLIVFEAAITSLAHFLVYVSGVQGLGFLSSKDQSIGRVIDCHLHRDWQVCLSNSLCMHLKCGIHEGLKSPTHVSLSMSQSQRSSPLKSNDSSFSAHFMIQDPDMVRPCKLQNPCNQKCSPHDGSCVICGLLVQYAIGCMCRLLARATLSQVGWNSQFVKLYTWVSNY